MANTNADLLKQMQALLGRQAPQDDAPKTSPFDTDGPDDPPAATPSVPQGAPQEQDEPSSQQHPLDQAAFLAKWEHVTENLAGPLNLLFSGKEDDFSGAIVVEDDYYLDEFLADLEALLVSLGKIKGGGTQAPALRRNHLLPFAMGAIERLTTSKATIKDVIDTRKLLVLDMIEQFSMADIPASMSAPFIQALGSIVDDRYLLLVGSKAEMDGLLRDNARLEPAFGEHLITLKGLSPQGVLSAYLSFLNNDLREQVTDDFRARFLDYVEFNGDLLSVRGRQLADYLAKKANAAGELVLPKDRHSSLSLDDMLNQIVGLDQVKKTVKSLESLAVYRKRAEGHGCKLPPANMHMVFEGNPGTGKTMVARLIATMLYKIGIIRRNHLVEASSKDLIAKYVGQTDKMVFEKVSEALGGVLFIDEAYALMPEGEQSVGYGAEAIAELVKCMEDYKDDLVVILAGYEHEMQGLIDSNPGLSSRIAYTFHFDDYTVSELMQIFELNVEQAGMHLADDAKVELTDLFKYFSRFKSFGNGRFVGEVLQKAITNHATALASETANTSADYLTLSARDIPSRRDMFDVLDEAPQSASELLEPLVGMQTVKDSVVALEQTVGFREVALRAGLAVPDLNLNMVLRGNPGTGKTTVARILGTVLHRIGAVPKRHFEEVEAKDLINAKLGGTADETSKALERAMGGVLFIDEAYALTQDASGREALAVLVKAMEDHKGDLVVMFAGYRDEMRAFIDENPGLASRIGYTFDFEDYQPDELLEIFKLKMAAAGFELGEGVEGGARDAFKYFHSVENFGNGRFVDRYIQEVMGLHAGTYEQGSISLVTTQDLPTIKRLCEISATDVLDCTDDEEAAALRRVAIHEAGHAVCRLDATGKTDIVLITIEHEGNGALGYVQHKAQGMSLPTAADLRNEMVCLLGGMAAEEVYLGSFSAGNSSDLEMATNVARRYVASYGMSDAGLVQYASRGTTDVATLPEGVLAAMRAVLDECLEDAKVRIKANRAEIDAIVEQVSERGTMSGDELLEVWNRVRAER